MVINNEIDSAHAEIAEAHGAYSSSIIKKGATNMPFQFVIQEPVELRMYRRSDIDEVGCLGNRTTIQT